MQSHVYLSKGKLLIPQVAVTTEGIYLEMEPVEMLGLDISDVQTLASIIRRVVDRGNPTVLPSNRANFPAPILPKYAGRRSWADFAKNAQLWLLHWDESGTTITPTRKGARGEFIHVSSASTSIPSMQEEEIARLILGVTK